MLKRLIKSLLLILIVCSLARADMRNPVFDQGSASFSSQGIFLSCKDYNCKCDNVTDDTAAINAMLRDCPVNGGFAYIPGTITASTTATGSLQSSNAATINVASTAGFLSAGAITIETNNGYNHNGIQIVNYTGVTATSFTGCSGSGGTPSAAPNIPVGAKIVQIGTCNVSSAIDIPSNCDLSSGSPVGGYVGPQYKQVGPVLKWVGTAPTTTAPAPITLTGAAIGNVTVASTTGFQQSGFVHMANQIATYEGISSTQLQLMSRGNPAVIPAGTTIYGMPAVVRLNGTNWAHVHNIGVDCNSDVNSVGLYYDGVIAPISHKNRLEGIDVRNCGIGIAFGTSSYESDDSLLSNFAITGILADPIAIGLRLDSPNTFSAGTIEQGAIGYENINVDLWAFGGYATIRHLYNNGSGHGTNPTNFRIRLNGGNLILSQNHDETPNAFTYSINMDSTGTTGSLTLDNNSLDSPVWIHGTYERVTSKGNLTPDPQAAWTFNDQYGWLDSIGERIRWTVTSALYFDHSFWKHETAGPVVAQQLGHPVGSLGHGYGVCNLDFTQPCYADAQCAAGDTCTNPGVGTTYYYKVACRDQDGSYSNPDSEVDATNSALVPLGTVNSKVNVVTVYVRGVTIQACPYYVFYKAPDNVSGNEQQVAICPGDVNCLANNQWMDDGTETASGSVPSAVDNTGPLTFSNIYGPAGVGNGKIYLFSPSTQFTNYGLRMPVGRGFPGTFLTQSADSGTPMTWGLATPQATPTTANFAKMIPIVDKDGNNWFIPAAPGAPTQTPTAAPTATPVATQTPVPTATPTP